MDFELNEEQKMIRKMVREIEGAPAVEVAARGLEPVARE